MHDNKTSKAWTAEPPPSGLRRWELAEAEAEADLIDADLERCGARDAAPVRPLSLRRPTEITEADLAEAECVTDLTHVDALV